MRDLRYRNLTQGEIELARSVFGNSIDYQKVDANKFILVEHVRSKIELSTSGTLSQKFDHWHKENSDKVYSNV